MEPTKAILKHQKGLQVIAGKRKAGARVGDAKTHIQILNYQAEAREGGLRKKSMDKVIQSCPIKKSHMCLVLLLGALIVHSTAMNPNAQEFYPWQAGMSHASSSSMMAPSSSMLRTFDPWIHGQSMPTIILFPVWPTNTVFIPQQSLQAQHQGHLHGYVRVPDTSLDRLLAASGPCGISLWPKADNKQLDPRYSHINVEAKGPDEVSAITKATNNTLGFVQSPSNRWLVVLPIF